MPQKIVSEQKAGRNSSGFPCLGIRSGYLERKFQTQLHRPAAAGTNHRIGRGHVGRGAATAERLHGRIIQSEPVLSAIGIREVRVIENVEELGAELGMDSLTEMPVLCDREV